MRANQKPDRSRRIPALFAAAAMALLLAAGARAADNEREKDEAASPALLPQIAPIFPLAQAVADEKAKAAATPVTAAAPGPQTWHIFTAAGVSGYDVDGQLPGRFQQYRDIPRGFFLSALDLEYLNKDSPWLVSVRALEVRERDQQIYADAWDVGKFRTQLSWSEIPDFISRSPTLYVNTAPGVLQVDPAIRSSLETLLGGPNGAPAPPAIGGGVLPPTAVTIPAAFLAGVRSDLATAPTVDIGTRRETGLFTQSWTPSDIVEVHFLAGQTRKHGNIPWGAGTFARQNIFPVPAPYTPADGVWEAIGAELPAPIDWRTDRLGGGVKFSGKLWMVGLDYDYEHFRNGTTGLTYDNWFRVTDAAGNPPGSASGRGRFARSDVAYPPSSEFQNAILRFGYDLPKDSQVRGVFSYGRVRQNELFLPYTLNTALQGNIGGPYVGLASNIPPGTLVYDTSSLPQKSLDANIRTITQEYAFVSRALQPMMFRLQYRSEDLDNNTPAITFPGFSRFGESHWVTAGDYYGVPIRNRPESYTKQDALATWRWDIAKALSWTMEYQYEHWDRTHRNVATSKEHTGRGRIDFTPASAFSFRADYRYSDRKPDSYITQPLVFNPNLNVNPPGAPFAAGGPGWEVLRGPTGGPLTPFNPDLELEFNQLRKFDIGPRKRHEGVGTADVHLGKAAAFSASFRMVRDDYVSRPSTPAADFSNLFYGALYDETWDASAEFSVMPTDGSMFFVNYTREQDRYGYLLMGNLITGASIAGPTTALDPCCAQYPIDNSWERHARTTLDSVQAGLNFSTPGDGWIFNVTYALSFSTEKIRAFNPYPPILPNSPRTGAVYPYPDVTDRFQELIASITRRFSKALELGLQYRYEPYRTNDFYLNDLSAYPAGTLTVGGIPTNVQRFLFLNARYGSYTGNQLAAFLKYKY